MAKAKDNGRLDLKVRLRVDWLRTSGSGRVRVLDAYGGRGKVWAEVARQCPDVDIVRTAIEKQRSKVTDRSTLIGDNMRYLPTLNLAGFDAVDLDAYGWPVDQLAVVADRAPAAAVFVTRGASPVGPVPAAVLAAAGIPSAWSAYATDVFVQQGEQLWDLYLVGLGFSGTVRYVTVGGVLPGESGRSGGTVMIYERLVRPDP